MLFGAKKLKIPTAAEALPGRAEPLPIPERHFILDAPLDPPSPTDAVLDADGSSVDFYDLFVGPGSTITVDVDFSAWASPGDRICVYHHLGITGPPVLDTTYSGGTVAVPVAIGNDDVMDMFVCFKE